MGMPRLWRFTLSAYAPPLTFFNVVSLKRIRWFIVNIKSAEKHDSFSMDDDRIVNPKLT